MLLLTQAISTQMQEVGDGIPDNCEHIGQYQRVSLFPRYEYQNSRLALVDWVTGVENAILETDLTTERFGIMEWSPDCRYLAAVVGRTNTYIWDTIAAVRVGIFSMEGGPLHRLFWSPTSEHVVVGTAEGTYLWHLPTNTQLRLETSSRGLWDIQTIEWDYTGGRVLITFNRNWLNIFSLSDGSNRSIPPSVDVNSTAATIGSVVNNRTMCNPIGLVGYYFNPRDLVLYDLQSREPIRTIAEDLLVPYAYNPNRSNYYNPNVPRSPGCRYLAVPVSEARVSYMSIWDLETGQRVVHVQDGRRVIWHPNSAGAIIESVQGASYWALPSGTSTLITETRSYGRSFNDYTNMVWDLSRNRFLAVTVGAINGVTAFDITTWQPVAFYDTISEAAVNFSLRSPENPIVIVSTSARYNGVDNHRVYGFALWNRDTGEKVEINTQILAYHRAVYNFSPSKRYLILSYRSEDQTFIYVWDMHNLPGAFEARTAQHIHILVGFPTWSQWRDENTLFVRYNAYYPGCNGSCYTEYTLNILTGEIILVT